MRAIKGLVESDDDSERFEGWLRRVRDVADADEDFANDYLYLWDAVPEESRPSREVAKRVAAHVRDAG